MLNPSLFLFQWGQLWKPNQLRNPICFWNFSAAISHTNYTIDTLVAVKRKLKIWSAGKMSLLLTQQVVHLFVHNLLCNKHFSWVKCLSLKKGVIFTLTLHNNDTTPRYNGVESMCGLHSIVPWCCVIVV